MDEWLNRAPCGFLSFRDDGTVVEVNDTLLALVAMNRQQLLGWHLEKILPPGGRIFYHTHVFPLLKLHGLVEEIYLALRSSDGTDVPVLFNAIRRQEGDAAISECVVVRMTQRNQYEEQLLQARRIAEEANSAKAKFLSMMSHDLRTPLTTISGNADLLNAGVYGPLNRSQEEGVESIQGACRVLQRMINDILEFAQLESGRVQVRTSVVQTSEAVARAESLMRVQFANASLNVTILGCDSDVAVTADPDKLQQILLNLLTNAVKFTPAGGSISIRCERVRDRVLLRVGDSGIGMRPEDLPRIFSPFVQLDAGRLAISARGVGLGLAISRDLAKAMGGEVTVESELGRGSIFTIDLPVADAAVGSFA